MDSGTALLSQSDFDERSASSWSLHLVLFLSLGFCFRFRESLYRYKEQGGAIVAISAIIREGMKIDGGLRQNKSLGRDWSSGFSFTTQIQGSASSASKRAREPS